MPILLIAWNIFDIIVHVAADLVEPLRIAGNIAALIAAGIVLSGLARNHAHHVLGLGALFVVALNVLQNRI